MKLTITAVYTVFTVMLYSQNVTPKFSFKDGLGITTPDSNWTLNMRFRMQLRAQMNSISGEDIEPNSFNASVARTRLSFRGNMISPKFGYYLQLAFSTNDQGFGANNVSAINNNPNIIRDAVFFYRPNKEIEIGFGQTKLPGNRERVVSSGSLQFFDRSIANAAYNIDRDFGVFLYTNHHVSKESILRFRGAISSGEGRNIQRTDNGLCYTGRVEYLPFGSFKNNGDYFEGDIEHEDKPKLSVAATYSINSKAIRTNGQIGNDLFQARSLKSAFADMMFKYKGLGIMVEYLSRNTDSSITQNTAKTQKSIVTTGNGWNTQVSYCFKNQFEIAARYCVVNPQEDMKATVNQQHQMTLGVTKYFNKHKFKVQGAINYFNNYNLSAEKQVSDLWAPVVQVEIGI
jgi:phosphate-selective porin OprO/OprP